MSRMFVSSPLSLDAAYFCKCPSISIALRLTCVQNMFLCDEMTCLAR